ncbi:MAG TPA: VWA domain-containing protein, partial [Planctomycetota bacterium]|nr:VWA domain-containing protein [Planctomycetota bacterium]
EDGDAGEGRRFLAADEAGLERGNKFLRGIEARGGTELDAALRAALEEIRGRAVAAGRVPVVVLLTDGQVADESRVLKRIQAEVGDARVFTVGIDTAVNEGFLRRLASLGGGTCTLVQPGAALEEALASVGREVGAPLVIDVEVHDFESIVEAGSVAPARIPDLFAGRAATAFLRLRRPGRIRITGRFADGGRFEESVEMCEVALPAIGQLWAKARVTELEDRFRMEVYRQAEIKAQIVALGVKHAILTRFTAFVAVDEAEVANASGERRKIVQPVENPAGWSKVAEGVGGYHAAASLAATGAMPAVCGSMAPPAPAPARAAPPVGGPPQAPSSPAMNRSGGGIGSAIAGAIGAIGGAAGALAEKLGGRASKSRDAGAPDGAAASSIPEEERLSVARGIEKFGRALEAARAELQAGRVPPPEDLEMARAELLRALAGSELGLRLPALQRFLRGAAAELVAALRDPRSEAAALRGLLDRHAKAFEAARAEALPSLATAAAASDGKGKSFWEASV